MKIKIDKADQVFSLYIRNRDDWTCRRCSRREEGGMQNSHYFGRGKEATRFEPTNCDTLCFECHQYWGSEDRESYRDFKIKQLGESGFKFLTIQASGFKKKDRKLSLLIAKQLLNELQGTSN